MQKTNKAHSMSLPKSLKEVTLLREGQEMECGLPPESTSINAYLYMLRALTATRLVFSFQVTGLNPIS